MPVNVTGFNVGQNLTDIVAVNEFRFEQSEIFKFGSS